MGIFEQFNLPTYVKGKSFADASKAIQNKFEGRTDKDSMATKTELLERLKSAQEFVKQAQENKEKPQSADIEQMPEGQESNEFEGGGMMDLISSMSKKQGANGASGAEGFDIAEMASRGADGATGYIGAATTAMDFGKEIFGNENIDTSGTTQVSRENGGAEALGGAMKGAQAGMMFGPIGTGAGAVIGGAAGLIGANKHNKEADVANRNYTYAQASKLSNNFEDGGEIGDPIKKSSTMYDDPSNYYKNNEMGAAFTNLYPNTNQAGVTASYETTGNKLYSGLKSNKVNPETNRVLSDLQMDLNLDSPESIKEYQTALNIKSDGQFGKDTLDATKRYIVDPNLFNPNTSQALSILDGVKKAGIDTSSYQNAAEIPKDKNGVTGSVSKAGEWLNNNKGDILRYAPAAMNAYQLAKLKKPDQEALDRINTRYKEQNVDEQSLQNINREETNNIREAILNASGGSGAAARSNLLGVQLNSTKALSDAYMKASEVNRNESKTGQQFNLGVDQINLQQSNMQNDINARNKGNYETQKSKLLAELGNNIGDIGTEELFKKYPELMGSMYDYKGRYKKGKTT